MSTTNHSQNFNTVEFQQFILDGKVYGFFESPITLKSGRTSHFYANWRNVVEDAFRTKQLAQYILQYVKENKIPVDTFYGVPEGATKIGIIAQFMYAESQPNYAPGSHVLAMGRAKPKEHGAPKDKYFVGMPQGKVIMLEDVTTTGDSMLKALDALLEAHIEVSAVISLTNRMEKRDDNSTVADEVKKRNVHFYSMSTALEMLPLVCKTAKPSEHVIHAIETEFARYGVKPIKLQ